MVYQIKVKGSLDKTWSSWLGDVDIRTERGEDGLVTTLTVRLADQSALFGILDHIRDLNLILVSVHPASEEPL